MGKKEPVRSTNFEELLAAERAEHEKTRIKLAMRENENHAITKSTSYRIARALVSVKVIPIIGVRLLKSINPITLIKRFRNNKYVTEIYRKETFKRAFLQDATSSLAVIIHLYYPEMAEEFRDSLSKIVPRYDLYISIPDTKGDDATIKNVSRYLPNARIAIVPNCGRDVLPFVAVMKALKSKGYKCVLKLHSKKSPHRQDGDQWRQAIVNGLLPDEHTINEAMKQVANGKVAIIGPRTQYVSALVNYSSTINLLGHYIRKIIGDKQQEVFKRNPQDYGFFGGTMFWANYDAMMNIIEYVGLNSFEPEFGQEDTTLAHALERLFCIIPELQNMQVASITEDGKVISQSYETVNIPIWAKRELGIPTN